MGAKAANGSSKRGRMLNVRVNDAEMRRLEQVAEHFGLGVSNTVRMLAKQAYEQIQREKRAGAK